MFSYRFDTLHNSLCSTYTIHHTKNYCHIKYMYTSKVKLCSIKKKSKNKVGHVFCTILIENRAINFCV